MANYVCTELSSADVNGIQHCVVWAEYVNSLDMLAITEAEANMISMAMLSVIFGAWSIRQVQNMILRRRY